MAAKPIGAGSVSVNNDSSTASITLAEDTKVENLEVDQLKQVFEQLTDFNKPNHEKSPLVRKLNNAAKDESCCLENSCDLNRLRQQPSSQSHQRHHHYKSNSYSHHQTPSASSLPCSSSSMDVQHVSSSLRTYSNNQSNARNSAGNHSNSLISTSMPTSDNNNTINKSNDTCHSQCMADSRSTYEMQDLRKKAQVMTYKSCNVINNNNAVDNGLEFKALNQSLDKASYEEFLGGAVDSVQNGIDRRDSKNDSSLGGTDAFISSNNSGRKIAALKSNGKKKKKDEPKILAEHIEGFVGNKDVDELVHFITGEEPNKKSGRKSEPPKQESKSKRKNANTSHRQRSSSAESVKRQKTPSPLPVEANTSATSHATSAAASYAADDLTSPPGDDVFSDDEKGYHTDQDSGFKVMRTKKKYHRHKHNPLGNDTSTSRRYHQPQILPSPVTSSSLSATFSVAESTATSATDYSATAAITSRGYESEKEFYTQNDLNFQAREKRKKATSSLPDSERNSPENSDVDSSLSLPFVHRVSASEPTSTLTASAGDAGTYASKVASSAPPSATPTNVSISNATVTSPTNFPPSVIAKSTSSGSIINFKSYPPISSSHADTNYPAHGHIIKRTEDTSIEVVTHGPDSAITSSNSTSTPLVSSMGGTSLPCASGISTPSKSSLSESSSTHFVASKSVGERRSKSRTRSLDTKYPPVIMCEDRRGVQSSQVSSVTFGFFEDSAVHYNSLANQQNGGSPSLSNDEMSLSPVDKEVHLDTTTSSKTSINSCKKELDFDSKSFNYNEVLAYITDVWNSVRHQKTTEMEVDKLSKRKARDIHYPSTKLTNFESEGMMVSQNDS